MRLLASRKGVSEIISALLIICITVSAATLFAAYASGLMGKIQPPVASQPYTEQFSVEYYNWNTLSSLTFDLRNTGEATVNLATADYYLSGVQQACSSGSCVTNPSGGTCTSTSAVAPATACLITLAPSPSGSYSSGIAYVLKIVLTKDGAIFTFSLIAGSYTH